MSWKTNLEQVVAVMAKFPFKKEYAYGSVETSEDGKTITLINKFGYVHEMRIQQGEWGETEYYRQFGFANFKIGVPLYMNSVINPKTGYLASWGEEGSENHWTQDIWDHLEKYGQEMFDKKPYIKFTGGTYSSNFWEIESDAWLKEQRNK